LLIVSAIGPNAERVSDPGSVGNNAPTNRSTDQATLLRELIEALTALGNYLAVAHREFENQPWKTQEALSEALRKSLCQYERAAECLRWLRQLPPR
jgi:hypothetical protein